jgi:RNA recognition motif-containing protein
MAESKPADQQASALDHPNKVFAGNLSFKTTEEELKSFFGAAGTVVQASVITRGTRSLGYGFVAFNTAEECQAAVDKLHKKELSGREINVEIAKPKAEIIAARKERQDGDSPKKTGSRRVRRNKARAPPKKKTDDKPAAAEGDKPAADGADAAAKKRKPRKKKKASKPVDPDAPKKERTPRPKRVPTGEPSKTTIFVANLPFSLDDEGLRAVFKDYKVKSAKVILRRASGRSKGFGFVELDDEAEQQKVLAGGPYVSEERELSLKIALADERHAEEEKKE